MLGAIKRRWKPKRSSPATTDNNNFNKNINNAKNNDVIAMDMAQQRTTRRGCDEKPRLPGYSDTDSLPPSPTPNICIEGGRIEFVRSPSDGSSSNSNKGRPEFKRSPSEGSSCPSGVSSFRGGRGFYTTSGSLSSYTEKTDLAKEALEARVRELERLLESEQQSGERERLAVSRLQRQLAKRDTAHRDVERERRRRVDTETKCKEAAVEAQRYRNSLAKLQKEFNRMEESLRGMVHLKSKCDVLAQEKAAITAAYEARIQTYQNTIGKLGHENQQLRNQLRLFQQPDDEESFYQSMDLSVHERCFGRLRALEEENANLCQDSETAKRQYERCLDDIANQVVRALLSQKGLREEISNLQRRIKDLESQNHALANLLVHRLSRGCDESWMGIFSPSPLRPDDDNAEIDRLPLNSPASTSRLHSLDSLLMLPLQRPRSLHLHTSSRRGHKRVKPLLVIPAKKPADDEGNESPESGNRDEGYSTMSSDVQVIGETSEVSRLGLEDLKEATDEGEDVCSDNLTRPLVNSQHQSRHVTRSYSDSHLCLRNTTSHRSHRRSRAVVSLLVEDSGGESVGSGGGGGGSGSCWWDQQWLRLDDARQMEMDRSELENWSLSCEDMAQGLPSIKEIEGNWSSGGSSCDGSLVSEEASEPSAAIGTDFTRDFYRLVKFESTRSLESSSSRSHSRAESHPDRELALQSVLNFIAEQQKYCHSREEEDITSKDCYPIEKDCTGMATDSGNCHAECDKLQRTENFSKCLETQPDEVNLGCVAEEAEEEEEEEEDLTKDGVGIEIAESLASSLSTPDTIVVPAKIASPKIKPESCKSNRNACGRETKIPVISTRKPGQSPKKLLPVGANKGGSAIPVPTSRKDKPLSAAASSSSVLIVGQSSLNFHERASSKDVIDELNRMIRKGEEPQTAETTESRPIDDECAQPTGWIHVEREIDFTDPKARANLLDVMLASSESSETGSDSGGDDYTHLHRLHRFRRHKLAMAGREPVGAVRWPPMSLRPSIVGREGFFFRFGRQEQDAVAMFDFLEELSTTSVSSVSSSCDALAGSQHRPAEEEDDKSADLVSFSDSCADSFSSDDIH